MPPTGQTSAIGTDQPPVAASFAGIKSKADLAGNDVVVMKDSKTTAWTSFRQALFGATEFRYLK